MPEEDDEALGQMLGDRLKGVKGEPNDEEEEGNDVDAASSGSDAGSASSESSDVSSPDSTESTQITQSTDTTTEAGEETAELESEEDTVRSRSPFPLYITPDLKGAVQTRFEKFNAQRTLNDEPQVEKHKHFMEGLLRAGLEHPELEEYVLDKFEDN